MLDDDAFEEHVLEASPPSGFNSYDKESDKPIITPEQLVDACRNYFDMQEGEDKGLVSLANTETPVYEIFSKYLEELDNKKLGKEFKPSEASQDADRETLSRIQMISFACAYLKWSNK